MASLSKERTRRAPGPAGGAPQAERPDRSGWLLAIPAMGVAVFCCGPLVAAWVTSAGLVAVVGSVWAGASHWAVLGVAVVPAGGLLWWLTQRRSGMAARRTPR